ncbi:hypothetical protein WMY93_033353, partial [Mugilogobius chulae]
RSLAVYGCVSENICNNINLSQSFIGINKVVSCCNTSHCNDPSVRNVPPTTTTQATPTNTTLTQAPPTNTTQATPTNSTLTQAPPTNSTQAPPTNSTLTRVQCYYCFFNDPECSVLTCEAGMICGKADFSDTLYSCFSEEFCKFKQVTCCHGNLCNVRPNTTTKATPTNTSQAPPTNTTLTQAPPTNTTQAPPTNTTQAPPTNTTLTQAPPTNTTLTQAPPTNTTLTQATPTNTTLTPPTNTTQAPPTNTTQAPPTTDGSVFSGAKYVGTLLLSLLLLCVHTDSGRAASLRHRRVVSDWWAVCKSSHTGWSYYFTRRNVSRCTNKRIQMRWMQIDSACKLDTLDVSTLSDPPFTFSSVFCSSQLCLNCVCVSCKSCLL